MYTAFAKNKRMAVRAYAGDAMTMLAFDILKPSYTKNFAGFTVEFKNETMPEFKALNNRVGFDASEKKHPSTDAPFQKFRWVHVLRNFTKDNDKPFFGEYQYRITPRYFENGQLIPFQKVSPLDQVTVSIHVGPFVKGDTAVSFTRGFLISQAYTDRFGSNANLRPKRAELTFDTQTVNEVFTTGKISAGTKTYTYEEQYAWLGFNARKSLMDFIEEVIKDKNKRLDVLAYDFSEPVIATKLLQLATEGRLRMMLDDHDDKDAKDSGGKKGDPLYKKEFAEAFEKAKGNGSLMVRHHFSGLAHCKIMIQTDKTHQPVKVLTGSANFTVNGLYINANHIVIMSQPNALKHYGELFEASIRPNADAEFKKSDLAQQMLTIDKTLSVGFAPHPKAAAESILNQVTDTILNPKTTSVLFAVMELESTGSVSKALREIHRNDKVFSLGITDKEGDKGDVEIKLYEPRSKRGVLVNGKDTPKVLPPPFDSEASLGLGHQVHHKFVVTNFNQPDATVYCGSSNLALGGETKNGDNLLKIQDPDIAAAFAIEAIRLIDHFQFRNRQSKETDVKPLVLSNTDQWAKRYFDPNDLYCLDRKLFIGKS